METQKAKSTKRWGFAMCVIGLFGLALAESPDTGGLFILLGIAGFFTFVAGRLFE